MGRFDLELYRWQNEEMDRRMNGLVEAYGVFRSGYQHPNMPNGYFDFLQWRRKLTEQEIRDYLKKRDDYYGFPPGFENGRGMRIMIDRRKSGPLRHKCRRASYYVRRMPSFAVVEDVMELSPATYFGLLRRDRIFKFGSLDYNNFFHIRQLHQEMQNTRKLEVHVERLETHCYFFSFDPQHIGGEMGCIVSSVKHNID